MLAKEVKSIVSIRMTQKKALCVAILFLTLVGTTFSQTSLPKKAKLKTIQYENRLLN